jgi:hypothetical protein
MNALSLAEATGTFVKVFLPDLAANATPAIGR